MSPEQQDNEFLISGIEVDLVDRTVTFESQFRPPVKIPFSEGSIYFKVGPERLLNGPLPAGGDRRDETVGDQEPESNETVQEVRVEGDREPLVQLSGRLKSKPKEGRPDAKGHPTAWARFAVHEEGSQKAKVYSATFHRHTARIALGLPLNAAVTIEGYPHTRDDSRGSRLDTLSVVKLLNYTHPTADAGR